MIRAFIHWNKAICYKLENHLPYRKGAFHERYLDVIAGHINRTPGALVVDIGGGEQCPFAKLRDPALKVKIIAVDMLPDALEKNRDVDETIVANVEETMPFEDNAVDLITSRTVLEHIQNNDAFFHKSMRALRPGGYFIHVFPAKYALFTTINRILPHKITKTILHHLLPEYTGLGFPAYYDHCTYSGMKELLTKHGFEIIQIDCIYYQASYFSFFLPFFLLCVAYEWLLWILGLKNLCSYLLIVARKNDQ